MKSKSALCQESIDHWERMVEKCKWLMESNFHEILEPVRFIGDYMMKRILGENYMSGDCPLCDKSLIDTECPQCPLTCVEMSCQQEDSPWRKTTRVSTVRAFVRNAEQYMIPALRKAKEWCEKYKGTGGKR